MTIDFSKMNEGDTVKFKSGGEVIIRRILGKKQYHGSYILTFEGCAQNFEYRPNGTIIFSAADNSPFDIVEIIPKPFDWDTLKNGMAFEYITGADPEPKSGLYYYIAPCLNYKNNHWFSSEHKQRTARTWSLPASYLKRMPEHDLKAA